MDSDELEHDRPMAARCQRCGELPRWESLVDGRGERWLALCRCGHAQVFLPDEPNLDPEDPVKAFLQGPENAVRPTTPPWIRLFLRSVEEPWRAVWRYWPNLCPACATGVCFFLHASPRPYWLATCSLCLSCGRVTSTYSQPWKNLHELPVAGSEWAPPCPAVQRLRDCIFRPYARLAPDD